MGCTAVNGGDDGGSGAGNGREEGADPIAGGHDRTFICRGRSVGVDIHYLGHAGGHKSAHQSYGQKINKSLFLYKKMTQSPPIPVFERNDTTALKGFPP